MSGSAFFTWLRDHEPPPDEGDTEAATQEFCPVVVTASALETQEAYVIADDEPDPNDTQELPVGFWQRYFRWRQRWLNRWGA